MGRSKQNKQSVKKEKGADGKQYRKETKEERKERLRLQQEAREQCFKMIPYVGGVIVFLMLLFAVWVRSVPPKAPAVTIDLTNPQSSLADDPALKEALKGAEEALRNMKKNEAKPEGEAASDESTAGETIEL